MLRAPYIMLLGLCVLASTSCLRYDKPKTDTGTSGTMDMICDNSFQNIMEQEIGVFEFQYPEAHILCRYLPAQEALDSLMQLRTKTIVIPRPLTAQEVQRLKDKRHIAKQKKIAVDALALIVNPANPVDVLTMPEIEEILTGKVSDWNQISPNQTGPIRVVFDHSFSSTTTYMRDSLMGGQKFGPNVYAQDSIQGVFNAVATTKGAIGVIGVSWLNTDLTSPDQEQIDALAKEVGSDNPTEGTNFSEQQVKVLKVCPPDDIHGYKPYQQNIYDGTYPLTRQIYMITYGANGGLNHGFFSFVTGAIGQKIILKTGIMPGVWRPQVVELPERK